jgi:glycosyltransferase involved in cell wall biosynthesis
MADGAPGVVDFVVRTEALTDPRATLRSPMITYIFRKRLPTVFSIEKIYDALFAQFARSGLEVHRLELPYTSTGLLAVFRNAWFVARRLRGGHVHITGDVHYAALFRPLASTVITIHDCVVLQRGKGLKRLILWLLWFWLPARTASAVTVVSAQIKDELLKTVRIEPSKISIIPNFVDPAFVGVERPFASQKPRILHIGTTPNKNLSRVIAALRDTACELVIIGPLTAPQLHELHDHRVTFENFVGIDHAAVRELYANADIISFPSTYEGFGMPILEGQAVGRPILTSDLEPMRSVAGTGGAMFVDPRSVQAIREGFAALMADSALRSRLVAAGKENCSRFTLEAITASYLALYRAIGWCG